MGHEKTLIVALDYLMIAALAENNWLAGCQIHLHASGCSEYCLGIKAEQGLGPDGATSFPSHSPKMSCHYIEHGTWLVLGSILLVTSSPERC